MAYPVMLALSLALVLLTTDLCQAGHATNQKHNGFSLELIHRDSPSSPLYRPNLTNHQRMINYIQMSHARVESFARLFGTKNNSYTSQRPDDFTPQPSLINQGFIYLIKVGIGTFNTESPTYNPNYLALDTGSDLTWTQCAGCSNCFHQVEPYFPANFSLSYQPLPCNLCPSSEVCQDGYCKLERKYLDNSKVEAIAAQEKFTFEAGGGTGAVELQLLFGCGMNMLHFTQGDYQMNMISGFMGLGYGYFSLLQQESSLIGGRFSYCLRSFGVAGSPPNYLRFGDDVIQKADMRTIPLSRNQDSPMYYLNLQGISVDNNRLGIDPTVFQIEADGTGGFVIDSGTVASYVVTDAYLVLEDAIDRFMEVNNTNLRKMVNSEVIFKLCYERYQDPVAVILPVIKFHFENNTEFVMEPRDTVYTAHTASGNQMFCLMFFESTREHHSSVSYLGAVQQANQRIIYDIANSQLHFAQTDCLNNN